MTKKRKPTYQQALALQKAQHAARTAARRRAEAQRPATPEPEAPSQPSRCPECEGTRRHDEFCSRPVELGGQS